MNEFSNVLRVESRDQRRSIQ